MGLTYKQIKLRLVSDYKVTEENCQIIKKYYNSPINTRRI